MGGVLGSKGMWWSWGLGGGKPRGIWKKNWIFMRIEQMGKGRAANGDNRF